MASMFHTYLSIWAQVLPGQNWMFQRDEASARIDIYFFPNELSGTQEDVFNSAPVTVTIPVGLSHGGAVVNEHDMFDS